MAANTVATLPLQDITVANTLPDLITRVAELVYIANHSGGSGVTGSGTSDAIAKWATSGSLTNSVITENTGNIGIGTTTPGDTLTVNGTFSLVKSGTGKIWEASDGTFGFYVSDQNALNMGYGRDADADFWINYHGYQAGNTRFRTLKIGDGKTNLMWGVTKEGSINSLGNLKDSMGVPVITSGFGSGASISGIDYGFVITLGTITITPVTGVVTFGHTFGRTPVILGNRITVGGAGAAVAVGITSANTSQAAFSFDAATGDKVHVHVQG